MTSLTMNYKLLTMGYESCELLSRDEMGYEWLPTDTCFNISVRSGSISFAFVQSGKLICNSDH